MSNAPHFDIDVASFWADPYPALAKMRAEAPIAFVPQLGSTIFTRRDDIFVTREAHRRVLVASAGRTDEHADGPQHDAQGRRRPSAERTAMFPAVSPRTVKDVWRGQFQAHADRILDELAPHGRADLVKAFALPLSGECLKHVTGLTNIATRRWTPGRRR